MYFDILQVEGSESIIFYYYNYYNCILPPRNVKLICLTMPHSVCLISVPANYFSVQIAATTSVCKSMFPSLTQHNPLKGKRLQVRFKTNIPLQCRIINCTLCLPCTGYCLIVIILADMILLEFVYMYTCDKLVVSSFRS